MTIYEKVVSIFAYLRSAINRKVNNSEIASEFSDTVDYKQGEMVMHDDRLYQCISDHHGPWDERDFDRKPIGQIMPMKVSDLKNDKGYIDAEDIGNQFSGIELGDNATQADTRRAVQSIISAMRTLATPVSATCLSAMLAASLIAEMPGNNTKWEDVDPTNIVKDVVVKFTPAPDFSTNNVTLSNTINATVDFSTNNEELVETIHANVNYSTNNEELVDTIDSTVDFSTNNAYLVSSINSTVDLSTNNTTLARTIRDTANISTDNNDLVDVINATVDISTNNPDFLMAVTSMTAKVAMYDVEIYETGLAKINLKNHAINILMDIPQMIYFPDSVEGKACEFFLYIPLPDVGRVYFAGRNAYYGFSTNWPFRVNGTNRAAAAHFVEIPIDPLPNNIDRCFWVHGGDLERLIAQ